MSAAPVASPCRDGEHYYRNVGRDRPVWRCAGCGEPAPAMNTNPRGTGGRCMEPGCAWTSDAGVFRLFSVELDSHRAAEHGR